MIYKQVIDLLTETKAKINALLKGKNDEHHRLKAESDLQRLITYLSLLTNTQATNGQPETQVFGPATTIGGKPIQMKEHVSREQLEPKEEQVRVLRDKVESTYSKFLTIESIDLLKNYDNNVIRGVAKKAKMKVTKEQPETITLAFIEEIKKNIIDMENRNQANHEKKEAAQQNEPDLKNSDDKEIQQGTQADVNDKGAAQAQELPSESEIRKETTSTPDVAKAPKGDQKPQTGRNQ